MNERRIVLASASPRRRQLLEDSGWSVTVRPAPVDDGELDSGDHDPQTWTMAMAWLKARAVLDDDRTVEGELLLAADTVCSVDDEILGQPEDREDARRMLHMMRGRSHKVFTGMCLLRVGRTRRLRTTVTCVHVGAVSDQDVDAYLDDGAWAGKAGAYNLSERMAAGWPLTCDGEPEAVMGLSLQVLDELVEEVDT